MDKKFTLKVEQVNTEHTTKFNMTVGEIYLRKSGESTGYAMGNKETYESREDAIETIKDLIKAFFGREGFDVEFKVKED